MHGFRKGNVAVYDTPIKDIVLINGTFYKIRKRNKDGKPLDFYPHSNFLTFKVLIQICLHTAWKKIKNANYKEKFRLLFKRRKR